MLYFVSSLREYNVYVSTGRSGVGVGRWRSKPYVVGSRPASPFSFSHVDVGDAFQFINHISANPYRPAVLSFCADLYSGFSYKFVFLIPGHGWTESSGSLR